MNKSGFEIIYDGSKVGLQNKEGQQVVPCVYDKILDYDDDGYIRVLIGEVYGTIDLEGKEVIPHSARLTHLGVFHGGTARAKKGKNWGLVDEKGNDVTAFTYQDIKAHYKNGYSAIDADGQYGWLTENGKFTPSKKKPKTKPKFERIATYHNGIAPAYTHDCKWIFIDKDQNRVGNYEYKTMDTVLRHGLYLVINEEHLYNFCKFDGEPLLPEWYDHIYKFDNGYAVFWKGIRDENGELKIFSGGQPSYMRGVIDVEGHYVIAPNYTEIRWADESKEYWYAEKWGAKYHLYPDGRRFLIMSYGLSEVSKDPVYDPYPKKPVPVVPEPSKPKPAKPEPPKPEPPKHIIEVVFDEDKFMNRLLLWIHGFGDDMRFFYRDADLDFNVEKTYKRGTTIRAGQYLEMTDKLKRPVHNTRFVIASNHVPTISELREFNREMNHRGMELPFKDGFLHFNSCFLVLSCIKYAGVNQVLLLHLPHYAVALAEEKEFTKKMCKYLTKEFVSLMEKAKEDLQNKMGELVHGYSLSSDWQKRMSYPVGLNDKYKPLPLKPASEEGFTEAEIEMSHHCEHLSADYHFDWNAANFWKDVPGTPEVP